jgi:hypothetical protein
MAEISSLFTAEGLPSASGIYNNTRRVLYPLKMGNGLKRLEM